MADRRPGSDTTREQAAARLRQRLWGATVLIALAVIVLPLLLDGSGSESQFRRVEKLREEPPRIVGSGTDTVSGAAPGVAEPGGATGRAATSGDVIRVIPPDAAVGTGADVGVGAGADAGTVTDADTNAGADGGADDGVAAAPAVSGRLVPDALSGAAVSDRAAGAPGDVGQSGAVARPGTAGRREARELPRAWVVQAGSFRERVNALAVLDLLRRDGHAAFVVESDDTDPSLYRVLVGPMVDETLASVLRDEVVALLGREAIVVAYP